MLTRFGVYLISVIEVWIAATLDNASLHLTTYQGQPPQSRIMIDTSACLEMYELQFQFNVALRGMALMRK